MSIEVGTATLPERANSTASLIDDETVQKIAALLNENRGKAGHAVTVGPALESENAMRVLQRTVRDKLAALDPPVHVRTHSIPRDNDGNVVQYKNATRYQAAVSLTPDGKPSARTGKRTTVAERLNQTAPANGTADAPVNPPADAPADAPAPPAAKSGKQS